MLAKLKRKLQKKIADDRYEKFDQNRKKAEALIADEEDMKQLEEIEKQLLDKRDD